MAIYRIQRIYSGESDQKKSGMSTLEKVALGTTAIGGGLAAAKFGMLGGAAQRTTNNLLMKAGKTVGSQGMINSGARGLAEGQYKGLVSGLKGVSGVNQGASNMLTNLTNNKTSIIDQLTHSNLTQVAFSEDTNKSLREAALIGTGLTLAAGGVLLAKHGKLGKTAKDTYDKVSGKIKKIWKETTKKGGNEIKTPGESPKTPSSFHTTTSTPKSPRITFNGPDWKKIKDYCKSNGLNFRNPKDVEKAAAALGIKPIK